MLYCYFGHHKCGTGWIRKIVSSYSETCGLKNLEIYDVEQQFQGQQLSEVLEATCPDFLSYTNADMDQLSSVSFTRGFHVVRDPRDVVVSAYFSHKNSHTTEGWDALIEHRADLERLSVSDGLLREIDFSAQFLDQMNQWDYNNPNILEVRMEDLTLEPNTEFKKIFNFLEIIHQEPRSVRESLFGKLNPLHYRGRGSLPFGMSISPLRVPLNPAPEEFLISSVEDNSFQKLAGGRDKGVEDKSSHYRKGISGDWKNYLSDIHLSKIYERYGDLIRKLGYQM